MVAPFSFLVLVSVSALLHQRSKALSVTDANRVLISYHHGFDNCKDVTNTSSDASKAAADEACEQAFDALDRLDRNTCKGWRRAKCRLISGQKNRQCTCKISFCDDKSIKNDIVKSFRECASTLRDHEKRTKVEPAPTARFQQKRRWYDDALEKARTRRDSNFSNLHGGPSSSSGAFVFTAGDASSSIGVQNTGGTASGSLSAGWAPADPQRPYQCVDCPRSYASERNLTEHRKSHTTDNTKCNACNYVFASRGALKGHIKSTHRGVPESEVVSKRRGPKPGRPRAKPYIFRDNKPGAFKCKECGNPYKSLSTLRDHAVSHTTLDTHCFKCKMTLGSRQSYRAHVQKNHPEDALAQEEAEQMMYEAQNPEVCDQCPKRFRTTEGLRKHKFYHDGKTTCEYCGAVFEHISSLFHHKAKAHRK